MVVKWPQAFGDPTAYRLRWFHGPRRCSLRHPAQTPERSSAAWQNDESSGYSWRRTNMRRLRANVTSDQMAMVGATSEGGRRIRQFHALCFRIWDNERHQLDRRTR